MDRRRFSILPLMSLLLAVIALPWGIKPVYAGPGLGVDAGGTPGVVPTYYANSPSGLRADPVTGTPGAIDTGTALRKFVDCLPGLGAAGTCTLSDGTVKSSGYIPVAVKDTTTYLGSDYYEIAIVEYTQQMHSDLPKATTLRGYVQLETSVNAGVSRHIALTYPDGTPIRDGAGSQIYAVDNPTYLGPVIVATKDVPVRVKYSNLLPTGHYDAVTGLRNGDLFLPVDRTLMGAGAGHNGGTELFTENRASIHLHGGNTPWISDGTPHQWLTPAGEVTSYKTGPSFQNVPDMPDPGEGSGTLFYTNQQSGRLIWYHDHSLGLTRVNVYAGEAGGYLIRDDAEASLESSAIPPFADNILLVIQDKTFVPKDVAQQDAKWDAVHWGQYGDLWFPHVYETNQDPTSVDGTNPVGRWDWGPWFWPSFPAAYPLPTGVYGDVTTTPEAFMDTPVINGMAYPTLTVDPKAYRFRILNASNDRILNLGLYVSDPSVTTSDSRTSTEIKMVAFDSSYLAINPGGFPSYWGTPDGRTGGVPDPATAGPDIIQIGSESGLLPAPKVIPTTPINYEYNKRSVTVLNILEHGLYMGSAERADVIIDFSQFAGQTLILYNDAPAPLPAGDPRFEYYTNNPDNYQFGGATPTLPGYGPNIRTIMQIKVNSGTGTAFDLATLNTALPVAYGTSQRRPIVAESVYNTPFGQTWVDRYANIFTGTLTTPTFDFVAGDSITYYPLDTATLQISTTPTTVAAGVTARIPIRNKAIQELFEPTYGRMNATLGVELPFTSALTQTTIPLGYVDPPTEQIADGETQIWKITHNGVDTHPVHFHLFDVQVINRVGWDGTVKPPDENELGWKETVKMNPLEDIIVAVRAARQTLPFTLPNSVRALDPTQPLGSSMGFTQIDPATGTPKTVTNVMANFGWEYAWHCHILGHEENDFMRALVMSGDQQTLPAAPSTLAATQVPTQKVDLTWADNSSDETAFQIQRATNSVFTVGLTTFTSAGANATAYTDSTVQPTTTYYYRVRAYNSAGYSAYSNTATVNISNAAPAAPSGLSATAAVTPLRVAVAWTDNSNNEDTFSLERATNTGFTAGLQTFTLFANVTAYSDTAVAAGTTYYYRVQAVNAIGSSAYSATANVTTPTVPGAPTIGTATGGVAQATVSFTAPASNGGSAITGYTVTSSPAGGVDSNAGTTATTHTITGLTNGTAYTFTVTATNAVGTGAVSAASNSVTPATVPGVPTIGTATGGVAQATVSFTAPVSDGGSAITGYTVIFSPAGGVDSNAGTMATTHTITGLTNGTAYTFTVTATNAVGTGAASAASNSVTPATVPGAPTIGTATAGNAQATVSFTSPASNGGSAITGYTVTSSPAGSVDSNAGTTATTHTITGLTNGTAYTFTVTATNVAGTGPASGSSNSVTPVTVAGAPTIGTATAGNAQATVSFTAPASNGGSAITGYTVTSSPAGGVDGNAGTTATTHTITGLTNGTAYTFTVTATNAVGTGAASAASSSIIPTNALPARPTGLAAAASILSTNPPTVTLTWLDKSSNEAGFTIQRATNVGFTVGLTTFTANANVTTYTDTTVVGNTKYWYRVRASNWLGNSTLSNTVTLTPGQLAAAPSSLATGTVTRTSVVLNWTDNATNESGFVIQRATNSGFTTGFVSITVNTPNLATYTRAGLTRNKTYYFRVAARNAAGNSAWSAVVSATTLP
jgi:FtsP/CotA-like multicopper oxidase with cupredoxin domain/cell division inhibitor SulA